MRCSWGTCNSDYRYPERCVGIKFIPFVKPSKTKPWNHEKCLRWIKACGRPHEQLNINKVNKNHYICSKHFVDGKPTIENPDPIQAITTTAESSSCRKRKLPMKRSHPTAPKMQKTEAAKILLSLQTSTSRVSDEPHTENSSSNVQLNSETLWMELVYHVAMEDSVETGPQDMEKALYNNIKQEAPDVSDADCDTNQEPTETEQQDVGGEFYNIKQEPTSVMINVDCDTNKEPVETEQQDVHRDLYNSIKQESLDAELPCVYIDCDTKQEPPELDYSHEPKIWQQCGEKTETQSSSEGYFPTNTPVNQNYRTMTRAAQDSQLDRLRQVNGEECSLAKERPFKCHLCHKAFTQERYVKDHVKIHTQEKAFKCNLCDKAVTTKNNLIRHIRTHTQERPFRCQICDKAFTQKPHLNNHYRVHTQERPFKCSMCDYDFKKKGDLDRHIKVHSQEKPYKCQMCDKAFTLKSYLILHIRNHTQEKPFKCKLCEKAFSQKNSLNQHTRIHTKEKPFKCLVCHKTFTVKNNLNRHIKIHAQDCIQYSTI